MPGLGNGQCSHRHIQAGRCLDLAITARVWRPPNSDVEYHIALCLDHAEYWDTHGITYRGEERP